jgi:hypothetical protein
MKTEIADKWIAALLSGEYQQTTGKLYDGTGYCCLGVLCKILGEEFTQSYDGQWSINGTRSVLSPEISKRVGMNTLDGCYSGGALTIDNDDGRSFEYIANIIDEFRDEL